MQDAHGGRVASLFSQAQEGRADTQPHLQLTARMPPLPRDRGEHIPEQERVFLAAV